MTTHLQAGDLDALKNAEELTFSTTGGASGLVAISKPLIDRVIRTLEASKAHAETVSSLVEQLRAGADNLERHADLRALVPAATVMRTVADALSPQEGTLR